MQFGNDFFQLAGLKTIIFAESQQRRTEVAANGRLGRVQSHCHALELERLVETIELLNLRAQIQVRQPAAGILGDGVAIQRFQIVIDA